MIRKSVMTTKKEDLDTVSQIKYM